MLGETTLSDAVRAALLLHLRPPQRALGGEEGEGCDERAARRRRGGERAACAAGGRLMRAGRSFSASSRRVARSAGVVGRHSRSRPCSRAHSPAAWSVPITSARRCPRRRRSATSRRPSRRPPIPNGGSSSATRCSTATSSKRSPTTRTLRSRSRTSSRPRACSRPRARRSSRSSATRATPRANASTRAAAALGSRSRREPADHLPGAGRGDLGDRPVGPHPPTHRSRARHAPRHRRGAPRRGAVAGRLRVARPTCRLLGLDEQLAIAKRTLGAYGESVKLFELQFKYGQVSRMNVEQARSQYETAAAQIPVIENQIAQTENALVDPARPQPRPDRARQGARCARRFRACPRACPRSSSSAARISRRPSRRSSPPTRRSARRRRSTSRPSR